MSKYICPKCSLTLELSELENCLCEYCGYKFNALEFINYELGCFDCQETMTVVTAGFVGLDAITDQHYVCDVCSEDFLNPDSDKSLLK